MATAAPQPHAPHDEHHHEPHLAHHFDSHEQQFSAGKLGMWIFLATEILFFGGLFCAYAVYRANHPEIFMYAHQFLDTTLGGINTLVLICSSLTMAWAVRAAQLRQSGRLKAMLALTLLCAFGFLGIKFVEYKSKWEHGLLWARQYNPHVEGHGDGGAAAAAVAATHEGAEAEVGGSAAPAAAGAPAAVEGEPLPADAASGGEIAAAAAPGDADVDAGLVGSPPAGTEFPAGAPAGEEVPPAVQEGPEPGDVFPATNIAPAPRGPRGLANEDVAVTEHAMEAPANAQTFFSIYFMMTGLHGIHVLVGIGVIAWLLLRAVRGEFADGYFTPVDLTGLYWHLVDLIWIYLFPLLYLIH